ncbi:MAG: lipoyl synthase [SAR324 cluster bacterium]|nr:lipoyl synthase [SAR324 cluster bacterium]
MCPSTLTHLKKPSWLKVKLPVGDKYHWLKKKSKELKLATVCEEAMCPNIGECWSGGTATFMILGDVCTRGCRFCAVKTSRRPPMPDENEPAKLAQTLSELTLDYVVLTTVDRDDLPDQGAGHISRCLEAIQISNPEMLIEILMPDFSGEEPLIELVCAAKPAVLAHNVETVARLTSTVRDRRANYQQSLRVLAYAKKHHPTIYTKSSIMVGLGEKTEEIIETMQDLRKVGVDFLTIGQYLRPNLKFLPVAEYVHPDVFDNYEQEALAMGFKYAACGPLVRSSYRAGEYFMKSIIKTG